MEDLFGEIECRTKSDSMVMQILRSAMDKTHEKLQSKDGPIQFLHNRSMFYELATILVESGLRIIQDQTTDILEDHGNKIFSDLTEIKDWLYGRTQDMEHLIAEKDTELADRLENELKFQEFIDVKEREILYLHEKVDPEREDIIKLKSSVDQQVSKIKQKLEDEKRVLNIERRTKKTRLSSPNLSFDLLDNERNVRPVFSDSRSSPFGRMSSDMDVLKETLDLAFGRMQSNEAFPLERQWKCAVEKDIESILVKGLLNEVKEGGEDDFFEFINEMTTLCYDFKDFLFRINDTAREKRGPSVNGMEHVRKEAEELNFLKNIRVGRGEGDHNRLERKIEGALARLDLFSKRDQRKCIVLKSDAYDSGKVDSLLNETEINKLKEERDGLCFRFSLMEDTYLLLLRGVKQDILTTGRDEEPVDSTEDLHAIFLNETIKRWKEYSDEMVKALELINFDISLECFIREDIYLFVLIQAAKDFNARLWNAEQKPRSRKVLESDDHDKRRLLKEGSEKDCFIRKDLCGFIMTETPKDLLPRLPEHEPLKQTDFQDDIPHSWKKLEADIDENMTYFEHVLDEKLKRKFLRLDALKREVGVLTKHVASMRKRKSIYKRAFFSKCHNLKLAETEVDLLGDQVESLLCLLEKLYFELNQNATLLPRYFKVYDLLILIERSLST